ncbi:MAG TPA: FimV/HubP family polar landmark protein [Gallionellaceae bacterium]
MLVLVWSNLAGAVGLGGINVTSALGRPLKAEIALVALDGTDKDTLTVRLASPADFKSAGIDYPYGLPKLSFEIDTRANGDAYVKLTSSQPVNEPFVSVLLELSWSSGRMLREYTFLLDPEGFAPEQPKPAEVQPVQPLAPVAAASAVPVEAQPAAGEATPEIEPAPVLAPGVAASASAPEEAAPTGEPASGVEPESLAAASAPQPDVTPDMEAKDLAAGTEAAPQATPSAQKATTGETITVKRGDTLNKIAAQVKPVDVSLERMVVALYHANRKVFDGRNMNRVRAGKILRVPEPEDVSKVTQTAAVKEIRAQVADWHAYRQKLAAAQGEPAAEQAPKREDAGKVSTAVADKAPAAKEQPKEVLKLSKGEAPGDKQIAAGALSQQDKHVAKEDDTLAKQKQKQDEQKRIEELQKISEQASKLVELKGQPQEKAAASPASAPVPASAVQPVKPRAIVPPQPVAPPPSLLDDLLGDPIMLGGGIAGLLALGGLGYVVVRRIRSSGGKKKSELKKEFKIEPIGSAAGSWAAAAPSTEAGDFAHEAAKPTAAAASVDDVDPIGEAELFLNFGRDAQAEEVLKDALSKTPDNIPVKLKLLSIYANRKDSNSFSRYAREIQQSGDKEAWEQAAAMGRAIDPANPIYGGSSETSAAPLAAQAAHEPSVDFDLGFGKPAAAPAATDFAMDFDVTGAHPGLGDAGAHAAGGVVDVSGVMPGEVARAAQETPMDFDVSGILPNELLKSAQKAEMDFDISSSMQATPASDETLTGMDFDVTGGNVGAKPAEPEPALDFGNLMFEMPSSTPKEAAPAPKAEPALDIGMPFTLDFPSSEPAAAPKAAQPAALDIDFADINLDLEATAVQAHGAADAAAKDEHWHEVATKLDLAKAYQEMGDVAGAREILDEVLREGDAEQRESAERLLQQL